MQYFYLRNPICIERLGEDQLEALERLSEDCSQETAARAGQVIEKTYKKVLAIVPEYDERGNLVDSQQEERWLRLLVSLKNQLEPIFTKRMETPVRILIQEM